MSDASASAEAALVDAARRGDEASFERLIVPLRRELLAHCYRMLGSVHDAEDALQESLLSAWRGLGGFEGRSSIRSWLYRVCTNACLRLIARRPPRMLSADHGPSRQNPHELGETISEPIWLEPWPDGERTSGQDGDPAIDLLRRESLELAFIAALQHLPATPRAVLILREALGFSAAEVAGILDTTPAAVNSALQRARRAVRERVPLISQQAELASLGMSGQRRLVDALISAWERADVAGLLVLLTDDTRFSMPPLPAWFSGKEAVGSFIAERMFLTPWRLRATRANGQLAVACYQGGLDGGGFRLGAVDVLTVRGGRIAELTGFLDPRDHRRFGLPVDWAEPADDRDER